MKNLQGLVSFVESAACGSFTAAAARLGLTPAAVSKNVMRLEGELEVRLFQRSTRRLKLTREGEEFLVKASAALRTLDEAVRDVTRASGDPAGRVRISAAMGFGRRFLLPALPRLASRYPRLSLELCLENRAVDLVAERFDISVRGGFVRDSGLVARRVARLPVVLVASPGYLREHGAPATPAALVDHRLLGLRFASGEVPAWRFHRAAARDMTDWEPSARVWASDPEALVDLALEGHGIVQTGLPHVAPHLRAGRLRLVLHGQHDPDEREIVMHYPHRQYLSARVRVVVDALLEHLRGERDLHLDPKAPPAAWCA